eukprot:5631029-Pyramimonas_sp.AAC.1
MTRLVCSLCERLRSSRVWHPGAPGARPDRSMPPKAMKGPKAQKAAAPGKHVKGVKKTALKASKDLGCERP